MQTSNSLLFGPQLPGQFGNFEPMFDPTMMAMLLDQLTQGQEAQGPKGRPGDGARMQQHYPQVSNSSTRETRNGVQSSGWDAAWGEEDEEESPAPYQSTGFSIPERGAARRYPAFQEMKDFARDMGARDDSMVGPESTPWEDESNLGRLDAMTHLAGRDLAEAVLQASPEQRDQITESEARLEEQLRDEEEMGSPVPMSRQRMMYAQNMDDLYGQGLVGDEIGQRNREYMQLLETRDRSAIDMGLKYGYGPPPGADPLQVEESAFNPRATESAPRQRAETRSSAGPAQQQQSAESRGGVKEVKLDKWGEGKVSSTWAALRSAGWSDKEIIENKLVDRVGEMNGLENPAKVQAGSTLKIPTKPGQGEREQTGPLFEADGGPAHRVPSWERQESPSTDSSRRTRPTGQSQQAGPSQPAGPSQQAGPTRPTGQTQQAGPSQPTGQTQPTGEGQPAEQPQRPPYDPSKDATDLYESMNGGLLGWGTDEDKLFHALEGKTPEQVSAIRTLYKDHYNRDLDADIKGDLSGKQLDRAHALLEGNTAAADADRLNHAMKGGFLGIGTDEKAVFETLEGKSPEQRQAILDEYSRRNNGADLRQELTGELSGAELDRANALLDGNQAKADAASMRQAMKGGFLGMGTDEDTLYRTLEGKSPEEREAIMREYGATYQDGNKPADLRADLKGELSGAELDRANALLDGNQAAADAAALNHAMKGGFLGLGTDEDTIYKTFEGKSEDERHAIVEAYNKYGSLDTHLNEELSGNDLEHAQKLVTNGQISDVDRLRYAMEGMGTDEEAVHGVLEGKSKDEIDSLRADYLATTGRTLDHDLEGDLSGRDLFDAQMSMKGRPESAEEAVQRQNERWEYERGEGNNVGNFFVDLFSDKGQLLDRNTSRMNEQLDRVEQLRSEGRMDEAREAEQRLSQLVDYTHDDVTTYREAKDSAADAAGTVAATAASVAVVVGTAGTATPLVVAGLAAGAGAGAKVLTKGAIEGRSYGWEEGLTDAGTGAIDGLSTAVGAKAGQVAASSVGKAMAARAEATLAREAAARTLTTGAEVAATTTTEAAATGTHASLTMGQRVMMGAAEGAVDGTVGGAAGGAGYTALDENTWKDGMLNGLERMAEGTAMGAGMGAVAGGVIGGGMPVAGSALSKGRELAGDAATWTRGRMADAGDMLRDGTGRLRQAGSDALEHARNLKANLPDGGEVVGRIKKAGQDFYDYGMDGGYIGKKLKAGRAGGEAAEEVVPHGPEAPTPPPEPQPRNVIDRIKKAGQDFYDNGMEGGIIGKRLKAGRAGGEAAEEVVPHGPEAPTPPSEPQPRNVIDRIKKAGQDFYDYGMDGGYVGKRLKAGRAGGEAAEEVVGPHGPPKAENVVDDLAPAGAGRVEAGGGGGRVSDEEFFELVNNQPADFQASVKQELGRLHGAGEMTPDSPARVVMSEADKRMTGLQQDIMQPLGPGTREQNEAVARVLGQPELAEKDGLVQTVINARAKGLQETMQGQGQEISLFDAYRREAQGTFDDMDKAGIALTPDQQALRANLRQYGDYEGLFDSARRNLGRGADEVVPAPKPDAPTPPSEPQPRTVIDRVKKAGQDFYDNGMEGGIIGKRLKGAGRQGAEDAVPTPAPKPDAPTPPSPEGPKPGKIKQFYDYGMNGGLVGNWLKKQDLSNLGNVGGKLVGHGRQILDDVSKAGKQFYDFGMDGGVVGKLRRAGEEVPAGAGGGTPPPLPKEGGGPPPLPKEGGEVPPPLPKEGGEVPPPLPKEGGEVPPPLPKEGGEVPPPLPKEGGELPPPLPKEGGEVPPPLPKEGGEVPPPLPKEGGEVPPPLPRQNADEVAASFRKRVEQFPDRPMLSRFREQASFNQLSPEQQHTVLELAARHKPEQPTGLLARLFRGSSEQTSAMEDSLQKLMRDGRLTNTDVNGVTLLDNLNQLDQAPRMLHRSLNPRALSEEVAATAANPAGVIKQGQRGTCSATTVQYIHASKNPSDYARVMRELTTEGEATLASGKKMTFNRTALGVDNSGRREADKIYQAAAMNHPSGRYDNWVVNPTDGTKGGHIRADGSFDYDGLTSKQGNELLSDIMGEKYSDVGYIGGAGDSPANRARFRQKMEEMIAQGEPMHVGLTWGEVGHGGHAVSVEGMDDQFVYIRNPHGNNASTNLEAGPRIRRENLNFSRDGRQRITHDEFFGRLQSYQSRPTTVRERDFLKIGDAYSSTPNPGDIIDAPETTARFKRYFPEATIDHMDLDGLKTFYEGFEQRLHRAGMEAAPVGKGNYREAMAELNEYMKNYGYPDGDFSKRGFGIG